MTEQEIFFAALDKGSPEERAAYLDGACGLDLALRRKVDERLSRKRSTVSCELPGACP